MSAEHANAYYSPPPLRVEEVPNGLICSICFGIPMKPKITPCEHVFCDGCAENALAVTAACPNCRMPCEPNQLCPMPRGTFMHRAWSTVMVKCLWNENGCGWTGSIVDATNHIGSCVHGQDNDTNPRISLIECEQENTMLKKRNSELETAILELSQQNSVMESAALALMAEMESKTSALERKNMRLSQDLRMQLPILFDDDYDFGRKNVVDLSQLISRYLEDKPDFIDSNRIFICVRNCYTALEKGYKNNPEFYQGDMKLLLSICIGTVGWFTAKQDDLIFEWVRKQGWNDIH